MANTLTATLTQILAKGMMGLREEVLLTRLVNTDYSTEARAKGQTIDIPIASDMGTADSVTPAAVPTAPADLTTATAQISLSNWYHKAFALNDQEIGRIRADKDFVPLQMNEAFRVLAKAINDSVFATYPGIYGFVGTGGTTPFGTGVEVASATNMRKVLNEQLCPRDMRRGVLDFTAEAAALNLAPFSDAEKRGSADTKTSGNLGKVFGFEWYGEDGVPTHTAGTAATIATDDAGYAKGVKSITMTYGTAGTGMLAGDVFTIAGDDQTYTVTTTAATAGPVTFTPGLKVAIAKAATVVTPKGDHVVNLGFHRDAFGLAMRAPDAGLKELIGAGAAGNVMESVTLADPVSKLVFRLELIRGYKMTMWDLDCLWGTSLVSPERACRLAG
ncbi:MAG: P22 phage major capsid protein family protein [Pseudomonas sp.]|nr:P22 phage major capsid protein family protein [Pseudomonas sp.]